MKNLRNTYEESAERLKELWQTGETIKGQRPSSKPSRGTLLSTHERHLKILSDGTLPVKTIIIPKAYPPSCAGLKGDNCQILHLNDLRVETRDPNSAVIVRAISSPYIHSTTIFVVEDEEGNVARLMLCNLEDTMVDPIFSENDILAIKQPCWTRLVDGGYHIRVDHPSDCVKLAPDDFLIPQAWKANGRCIMDKTAKEFKTAGDVHFLKKRFRAALECYCKGLQAPNLSSDAAVDLWRKKCGVDIVLLRLDDAAHDLAMAVSSLPAAQESSSPLTQPSVFEKWLHSGTTDEAIMESSFQIPKALLELASRIKFDLGINQEHPVYDFHVMAQYVGPLTLHLDCANYVTDTLAQQTERHGRGLFAKKDFKRGDLILLEKAFVLPGYFIADKTSDCVLFNIETGSATPRPGAMVFKELVQKLRHNPSCRKAFFQLDAGNYASHLPGQNGSVSVTDMPLDIFHVEAIRLRNSFSAPLRSLDLLHRHGDSNPEMRNGIWIHASYVNHCCIPNSVRTFIGDIQILRATRNVAAGEEITHQYVAPEVDVRERQGRFYELWEFNCDCGLCSGEACIGEEEWTRRTQLFEQLKAAVMKTAGPNPPTVTAIKKIAKLMTKLEALYDAHGDLYAALPRLALVHPTIWLVEAWQSVKNIDKTIEFALKLLRNFGIVANINGSDFELISDKGLVNVEVVRALKHLKGALLAKGHDRAAEQVIELARTWYICTTGSEVGIEGFFRG